tara:strand:- start:19 stop:1341 length:1323 start_codon:yes stop_codon:yes gene_type:complete
MDKTSAAYENFSKKMEAMSGGPKISRSTMKIGGGSSLVGRVANNEKKITLLKNIFKAQKQEIGDKITPKVNNLELSLNETSEILSVITEKLSLDMSQRLADQKALFDAQRKKNIDDKKDAAENKLEEKKKSKIGSKIAKTVLKPFGNLFDNLLNLAGILGGGLLATNLISRLDDDKFIGRIQDIYDWTTKNWKAIAIGAGVIGTIFAAGAIANFISGAGVVFGVLTNPVFLIAAGAIGLAFLGKTLIDKVADYYADDDDNTKNFVGNPPENAPENPRPGDFFVDDQNRIWKFDGSLADSSHGGWTQYGNLDNWFKKNNLDELIKDIDSPLYGGFAEYGPYTTRDLTNEYNQNLLNEQSGQSLLDFVVKREGLKNLLKDENIKPTIVELPPIDLTTEKRNTIGVMSNNPATGLPDISSMNLGNPYMEEVPELFGFEDIVYT